jgi:multidrug efflux pump subunit AcrB
MIAWQNAARILESRRDLLLRNGRTGLILVFASLALFLQLRLAFWVALGIFISFLGAFWLLPLLDVSLNMISLFAFIVSLGLVVDDAIVAGENIYAHREMGKKGQRAGYRQAVPDQLKNRHLVMDGLMAAAQ